MHPHEMRVVQASRLSRCKHALGRRLHTAPELSLGLSVWTDQSICMSFPELGWIKKPHVVSDIFGTTGSVFNDAAKEKKQK